MAKAKVTGRRDGFDNQRSFPKQLLSYPLRMGHAGTAFDARYSCRRTSANAFQNS
jgi:hypothetical protein